MAELVDASPPSDASEAIEQRKLPSSDALRPSIPVSRPPTILPKPPRPDWMATPKDRGAGWLRIVGGYRQGVLQIVLEEFYRLGFRLAPSELPDAEISVFWSRSFFPKLATLLPTQKVNWMPGMNEICRKDWLGKHITQFSRRFGAQHASFWPESFNLPSEWSLFIESFRASPVPFILKPPLAARGEGIRLYANEGDVEEKDAYIVEKIPLAQRYIPNPLLFHGTYKMSFRFYVALTSVDPLRIYVYRDGLVRICSTPYVFDDFANLLVHLTNYDLHVTNEQTFVDAMKDQTAECKLDGLRADWNELKRSLAAKGHDVDCMWDDIQDLITKSFIAAEGPLTKAVKTHVKTRGTAYEVTGFDVLLDDQLKPWLLEVNHTPSLCPHTDLENSIKREMLRSLYQLADVERKHVQSTRDRCKRLQHLWNIEKQLSSIDLSAQAPLKMAPSETRGSPEDSEKLSSEGSSTCGSSTNVISGTIEDSKTASEGNERSPTSSRRSSMASMTSSTAAFVSAPHDFPIDENGRIQPDRFLSADLWTILETHDEVRTQMSPVGPENG